MHRDNPYPYPPDHPYPPPDDSQYYGGNYPDHQHHHHYPHPPPPPHHHHNHHQDFYSNHQSYYPNNFNNNGGPNESVSNNHYGPEQPFVNRKRGFHHSSRDRFDRDGGCYAKLYVATIPRTVTEYDIRSLFGKHGNIVEVVFMKDKQSGLKQGACFVKYATAEEAERAIRTLHGQYTFPGEADSVKVKFADGEKERLGVLGGKLYVNHLNKLASKKEIEEIFSPYGMIEEVYILYDDMRHSKGSAFVKYSFRDMAEAAIKALNGTYIMKDCDQPLIVRFADPRKPRHHQQDVDVMPPGLFLDQQSHSHFPQPSQEAVSGTPRELNPVKSLSGREQHENLQSPWTTSSPQVVVSVSTASPAVMNSTSDSPVVPATLDATSSLDCDWSEHTCPDGYKYFYNCETSESRWEKPDEYALFENKVFSLIQLQNHSNQQVHTSSCQKELGQVNVPSATSMATTSMQQA